MGLFDRGLTGLFLPEAVTFKQYDPNTPFSERVDRAVTYYQNNKSYFTRIIKDTHASIRWLQDLAQREVNADNFIQVIEDCLSNADLMGSEGFSPNLLSRCFDLFFGFRVNYPLMRSLKENNLLTPEVIGFMMSHNHPLSAQTALSKLHQHKMVTPAFLNALSRVPDPYGTLQDVSELYPSLLLLPPEDTEFLLLDVLNGKMSQACVNEGMGFDFQTNVCLLFKKGLLTRDNWLELEKLPAAFFGNAIVAMIKLKVAGMLTPARLDGLFKNHETLLSNFALSNFWTQVQTPLLSDDLIAEMGVLCQEGDAPRIKARLKYEKMKHTIAVAETDSERTRGLIHSQAGVSGVVGLYAGLVVFSRKPASQVTGKDGEVVAGPVVQGGVMAALRKTFGA